MKERSKLRSNFGDNPTPTARSIPLGPELVPKPLWGISLYRLLPRKEWELIRGRELALAGNRCAVCSAPGPGLTCHEQWLYDDSRLLAVLVGFEIHCQDCDLVTHMGRALRKGLRRRAVSQFCKVNCATASQAMAAFEHAMTIWRARNEKKWTVGLDNSVIARYPALEGLLTDTDRSSNHA